MSELWELLPRLDGAYMHQFEEAYELHQAAGRILQSANTPAAQLQGLTPEQVAQRAALLKIPFQLIVNERNKALDAFCAAWIRLRGQNESSP